MDEYSTTDGQTAPLGSVKINAPHGPAGEVKRWDGVQVNAWGASLEPQKYVLRTPK